MLKKIEDMNYYELLEVSNRATAQEIHKAYERVRRIYDPNSIALYSLYSTEETERIRQRIEEAYRTLLYDENRHRYDLTLQGCGPAAVPQPAPSPLSQPEPRMPLAPLPAAPPLRAEPRPVPAAPPAPQVPATLETPPADIVEFTGPMLRLLREKRGLSLQNVADITKLSTRYLEQIEDENYAKLPVRPYLRGFLMNYAKALGYEPDRIVSDYLKRVDAAKQPPPKK